jgi:hypothetical protein
LKELLSKPLEGGHWDSRQESHPDKWRSRTDDYGNSLGSLIDQIKFQIASRLMVGFVTGR